MRLSAGLAFKPQHFDEALASPAEGLWFGVHAEDYMIPGMARLAMLEALRSERPVSFHGCGLAIASPERPEDARLKRLAAFVRRIEPTHVSELLTPSQPSGRPLPQLLPVFRTDEALEAVSRNIDIVQQALGRQLLVGNPAHYLPFDHEWRETDFLSELVRRTGCGLVIDVSNVWVSAHNLQFDPEDYLAELPHAAIREIHLGGCRPAPHSVLDLLVDSRDSAVAEPVWKLLGTLLGLAGPCPVLLKRDGKIPRFDELMAERNRAAAEIEREEIEHATIGSIPAQLAGYNRLATAQARELWRIPQHLIAGGGLGGHW